MTADTIARLTAILALDPTDTAAKAELDRLTIRMGGRRPRKPAATPRRSPYECPVGGDKPRGWKYFLVEIDGGQGGDERIVAPHIEAALKWARPWTESGDWPGGECEVSVRAVPYVWSGGKWWPDYDNSECEDVTVGDPDFDEDDDD